MLPAAELMREAVILAGGPSLPAVGGRKAWLARAARRLRVEFKTARALFYGTARRIDADLYRHVLAELAQLEEKEARLDADLAALESLVAQQKGGAASPAARGADRGGLGAGRAHTGAASQGARAARPAGRGAAGGSAGGSGR